MNKFVIKTKNNHGKFIKKFLKNFKINVKIVDFNFLS